MLREIRLNNFRCFDDHIIPIRKTTIIVGPNNAGKSTAIESLRLLEVVVRKGKTSSYIFPSEPEFPKWDRGIQPSIKDIGLNPYGFFHRYGDPPSVISASFDNDESVRIYVGNEARVHGVLRIRKDNIISAPSQARKMQLRRIRILPQIGPLLRDEQLLREAYVRESETSALSSLHFRNELLGQPELFDGFKELAESSWHGLRIRDRPQIHSGDGKPRLSFLIQDNDFTAEVGWMGHGLQMWLQTMWFLARCSPDDIVILDEPDVYMHADLQRKLIRLLRNRFSQVILATHSVEIMAEVEPDEIVVIDRTQQRSRFTTSLPGVQRIIDELGGVYNAELAKLTTLKRLVMVEGRDLKLLKAIQDRLYPTSDTPVDMLPSVSIGGWGGWSKAKGAALLLNGTAGSSINTFCILDSDYHSHQEITDRYYEAASASVYLHIWTRKELENFLLIPPAIVRSMRSSKPGRSEYPTEAKVDETIEELCESHKEGVFADMVNDLANLDRRVSPGSVMKAHRPEFDRQWRERTYRLSVVPGKALFECLSRWSQDKYGIGITPLRVARCLHSDEIDSEVARVIEFIQENRPFSLTP